MILPNELPGRSSCDSSCEIRRKPIYLLADSQLLFWKPEGEVPFLNSILQYLGRPPGKAAYVGAANGDRPEFYALFVAAMSDIGITECCHVHASPPAVEAEFLAAADLILLSGGDTELGLRTLRTNGVAQIVTRRYHAGCVLLGISAGAIQLGSSVIVEGDAAASKLLPGLGLVPFILDAHQEDSDWQCLSRTVQTLEGPIAGLGIPSGGGLLLHPDGTLEPVRTCVHEFAHAAGNLRHRLLLPAAAPVK